MRSALIFGVTGQDGSYLTELLLSKGYTVYGVARRASTNNHARLAHIKNENLILLEGDITDAYSVRDIIHKVYEATEGDVLEVYNLAAQSHVRTSFDQPAYTFNATACGAMNILEVIRKLPDTSLVRYYQASSSEQFGSSLGTLYTKNGNQSYYRQDENTIFEPRSPYAVAKLAAHNLTKIYRDGYGLFACNGILFNHESERRGENFVSRKITLHIGEIYRKYIGDHAEPGLAFQRLGECTLTSLLRRAPKLKLGNLSAYRDWGYAPDFVEAMWLMLQQATPDDYVIATGEAHTVKEFLVEAFKVALGYYSDEFVEIDPNLYRAAEVDYLCGSYSKAASILKWEPQVKFHELVRRMVISDMKGYTYAKEFLS